MTEIDSLTVLEASVGRVGPSEDGEVESVTGLSPRLVEGYLLPINV